MRRILGAAAILALACATFWILSHRREAKSNLSPPPFQNTVLEQSATAPATRPNNPAAVAMLATTSPGTAGAQTQTSGQTIAATEVAAGATQTPNPPAATAMESIRRSVREYGERFGGNPVGNNAEITRQLSGDNPRHINFLDPQAGARLNENGEMVDPWGTPYFFHQISGAEMEIHSAGPDKQMWNSDDLVIKELK
jgi:hypothetical protein